MALSTQKTKPNLVKTTLAIVVMTAGLGLLSSPAQASDDPLYDAFKDLMSDICQIIPEANSVPACRPFGYGD